MEGTTKFSFLMAQEKTVTEKMIECSFLTAQGKTVTEKMTESSFLTTQEKTMTGKQEKRTRQNTRPLWTTAPHYLVLVDESR